MMISFLKFMELEEELHPELENVLKGDNEVGKPLRTIQKIKELSRSGQDTGIHNNKIMKGSSRLYVKSTEPAKITVDGKPTDVHYGMKSVIKSTLDKHLDKEQFGHDSMGRMQNKFENGNDLLNKEHRVLTKNDDGTYSHNPHGIFPPLLDHDEKNHNWSKVGHSDDIDKNKFKELTKTPSHPEGIEHEDFYHALVRNHEQNQGRYFKKPGKIEGELDHAASHPLTKAFMDHQNTWGGAPHDFHLHNLGSFSHNGKEQIVARDHGFSNDARDAYSDAKFKKYQASLQK